MPVCGRVRGSEDRVQRGRIGLEIIWPGKTDQTHDSGWLRACMFEVARIERQHGCNVRTGGVSHQDDALRIAAIVRTVHLNPSHCGGDVVYEDGKANRWIESIVGQNDDVALCRKCGTDKAVLVLRAGAPVAPIAEYDDWPSGSGARRFVDVQLLPVLGPECHVRDSLCTREVAWKIYNSERGRAATREQ